MELPLTEYSLNVLFPYFSIVHLRSSHMRVLGAYFFILYGGLRCILQIHISEEGSSGREIYMLSYVKIICLKCHPQKGVYDVAT